ncbi:hypothetical protein FRB90_004863 [Tulasnella sp. 427]|nr:hypothetical protein FRB90_004863 [Tulasnella sp. 427]
MWRPLASSKRKIVRPNPFKGIESANPQSVLGQPDIDHLVTRLSKLSLEPSMLQFLLRRDAQGDTASSPVLLPELLDIVLSFCSAHDLTSAARVCKIWSEVALDHLWASMTSMVPLYTVLPCIHRIPDGKGYYLIDSLNDQQYRRFQYYAKRVRTFNLPETETPIPVSLSFTLHQRCAVLRAGPLFPRLASIEWVIDNDVENSVVFLQTLMLFTSSSLRTLKLSLKAKASKVCPSVLYVFASIPDIRLKHFSLTLTNIFFAEPPLLTLMDRQTDLEELRAPQISFTPQSLHTLLPALPHLRTLDIAMRLQKPEQSMELESAMRSIADFAPHLEMLRLGITPTARAGPSTHIWIPVSSLRPLLGCRSLIKLEINCTNPLLGHWNESDIVDMGRSWRRIAELSVCEAMAPDQHSGISLSLLPNIAANFPPTLTRLCLPFKDYEQDSILKPEDQPPTVSLPSLHGIGAFNEPITDPRVAQKVGRYIAAHCPMIMSIYSKPPMNAMVKEITGAINETRRDKCTCGQCKR